MTGERDESKATGEKEQTQIDDLEKRLRDYEERVKAAETSLADNIKLLETSEAKLQLLKQEHSVHNTPYPFSLV
jgi:predicted  nucleic acid-binding Zn-ribbon protein